MPRGKKTKSSSFEQADPAEGSTEGTNRSESSWGHAIGFIVIDGSGALFGSAVGGIRNILHRLSVDLPRKPGKGGQSALRQSRHNFVTKVAATAAMIFMVNNKIEIAGLVVAGTSDFKEVLMEDGKLDPRLQRKVTLLLDVPYGGEKGLNHAIRLASSVPRKVQLEQESRIIQSWLDSVYCDMGKACFGMDSTLRALEMGAVSTVLVWSKLQHRRFTLESASGVQETIVLSAAQCGELEHFWDATNGVSKAVLDEARLVDWLVEHAAAMGSQVELVSDCSPEGTQFCKGWGGIGAFLRYQLDVAE